METITLSHSGTCSRSSIITVDEGIIKDVKIIGGCPGNTQGLAKLMVGLKIEEVIKRLDGIMCRNGTSCPDQIAKGLAKHINK